MNKISEKYLYLPEEFHIKHDACFKLVGQIEEFITNQLYDELRTQAVDLTEKEISMLDKHTGDMLDFLVSIDKKDAFDRIIVLHTINALIIDICYFLQEALECSKKKRLVVTFSLLRRPLIYNMVIILRLLFEDSFLEKYISGIDSDSAKRVDFDAAKLKDISDLLNKSEGKLITNSIKGSQIFELVFDRSSPNSLINMSEKALHPVTTRNNANKTGAMNLNFMFSTNKEYYLQWQYIYNQLPAVLLYFIDLVDTLVFTQIEIADLDKVINERLETRLSFLNPCFNMDR